MVTKDMASTAPQVGISEYLNEQIATRVAIIRDFNDQMDAMADQIQKLKAELRVLLEQKGEGWKDKDGYARLTNEGVRTSYDTRSLDELIISEPLRYGWLKDYRKESMVPSTIQVR
jgi:hypothetical protein